MKPIPDLDEPWLPLEVRPIDNEPLCYWVQSASRPEIKHRVDLAFLEDERGKPKAFCSCERMMAAHDPACKHIAAVVACEKAKRNSETNL